MKRFVIEIEYDRHLVQARDEIVDGLETFYGNFNDWLHDKANDHGYWVATHLGANGKDGLCYDADAFLNWLNENHNAAARIIATESAGIHHSKEFFEWANANGYINEESIAAQIAEIAARFSITVEKAGAIIMWHDDDLYPVFVKETGCTPEILRLVEERDVKRVYF